jgi:hypothetical protein
MTPKCRSCGSTRVLRRAKLESPSMMFGLVEPTVSVPSASMLSRSPSSTLSATVCVDCGFVELYANDLVALQGAYERARLGTLNLQTEAPDAI